MRANKNGLPTYAVFEFPTGTHGQPGRSFDLDLLLAIYLYISSVAGAVNDVRTARRSTATDSDFHSPCDAHRPYSRRQDSR